MDLSIPNTPTSQKSQAFGQLSGKRIFHLEEDQETADMMRWIFALAGYESTCAISPDADQVLAMCNDFDLIMLEKRLPGLSGVALCRAIRRINPDIPIVFFSAYVQESDIEEGLQAGANAYLLKPNDLERIEEILTQLLGE